MTHDIQEAKPRNTDKKRIEALEAKIDSLTQLIRGMAHIIGVPHDLLRKKGIKPFDTKNETLDVNGRGAA